MKVIINSQQLNQKGENIKVRLQDVLDNRNDEYIITPRDISYYVGYYNVSSDLKNNQFRYSNGTATFNKSLQDGLYSLSSYFDTIKTLITNSGDNSTNINYAFNSFNGKVAIQVKSPYTFSIIQSNMKLLGFNSAQIINSTATSNNPIDFLSLKMLYVHLNCLKNNDNYYNGNRSNILARIPVTNDNFGTLVQHKFDFPYVNIIDNTTINTLELTITDENGNIVDFHGMPVFYTLEIYKNKLYYNNICQ